MWNLQNLCLAKQMTPHVAHTVQYMLLLSTDKDIANAVLQWLQQQPSELSCKETQLSLPHYH
jgi:hypothetical protein